MTDCERIAGCHFFNRRLAEMPESAAKYESRYCRGEWEECARYLVCSELGPKGVPPDLFPDERERAAALIAAG